MKHFRGPRGGNDAFGSAQNSQAAKINRTVYELGECSEREVVKSIKRKYGVTLVKGRVYKHFQWLTGDDDRGQFEKIGVKPFADRTENGIRLTEQAQDLIRQAG